MANWDNYDKYESDEPLAGPRGLVYGMFFGIILDIILYIILYILAF